MKRTPSQNGTVDDLHALALFQAVDRIMRRFKLEPGLIAGRLYADLHVNDVGLLAVLSEAGEWNVQKISRELRSPDSTISSALDRLEHRKLVVRTRTSADRRMVHLTLTAAGKNLSKKLRSAHIENCRAMLAGLSLDQREIFIRLASQVAGF